MNSPIPTKMGIPLNGFDPRGPPVSVASSARQFGQVADPAAPRPRCPRRSCPACEERQTRATCVKHLVLAQPQDGSPKRLGLGQEYLGLGQDDPKRILSDCVSFFVNLRELNRLSDDLYSFSGFAPSAQWRNHGFRVVLWPLGVMAVSQMTC